MAKNVIFNIAAAAILDFVGYEFWGQQLSRALFSVSVLYQILCKSVQKWRSYGRLTDFKIAAAAILDFFTMWILAVNLTVRPHFQHTFQIRCKSVQKWLTYGGRRHLELHAILKPWTTHEVYFMAERSHRDGERRIQKKQKKKGRTNDVTNWVLAPPTPLTIFGMWGGPQDVFLSFEFGVDCSPNLGATGCPKSPLPID